MSYIRAGHDLRDFKGESNIYVFPSQESEKNEAFVEDYDVEYVNNASLAQLLINMMRRLFNEEGFTDEKYIQKMIGVLSKKLDVEIRK